MLRICSKCGVEKTLESFVRQTGKYRKDPYRKDCKNCKNLKRRKGTISNTRFKNGDIPWNSGKKGVIKSPLKGKKINVHHLIKFNLISKEKGNSRNCQNVKNWKIQVLQIGKNKCSNCESTEHLHCHHIIPWKDSEDLRYLVDNGKVLCRSCHAKLEGFQDGHLVSKELREKLRYLRKKVKN